MGHPSISTVVNSLHHSQIMARWLIFFTEYNFLLMYNPGWRNVVADARSRRPYLKTEAIPNSGETTIAVLTSSALSSTFWTTYKNVCTWFSDCAFYVLPLTRFKTNLETVVDGGIGSPTDKYKKCTTPYSNNQPLRATRFVSSYQTIQFWLRLSTTIPC